MHNAFSLIRRTVVGAAAGAALALGPARLAALRRVWVVAGWIGWAVFGVYLVFAVLIAAGGA